VPASRGRGRRRRPGGRWSGRQWSWAVSGGGDAEVGGLGAAGGGGVGLGELLDCAGEADLESFGFSGPAFAFGFGDAGVEVVADVFGFETKLSSVLRNGRSFIGNERDSLRWPRKEWSHVRILGWNGTFLDGD